MQDDQAGGNSGAAVAEPVTGQTAPEASGTSDQNGQAATQAQSAPAEDSFSSVDPKTLSPELQAVYKSMQSDYTKKLQPIAEMRKKAEAFDQVSSRSDFRDWWSGASKQEKADFKEMKAAEEKRLGEKITDDEFNNGFLDKNAYLSLHEKIVRDVMEKSQKKIESLEQKLSIKDSQDLTTSFATEVGKDGKVIRPDFDELEEHNLISGFLAVNQPEDRSAQSQLTKLHEAYAWAKAMSQKFYEKGKAETLQNLQKKVASSTEPPTQAAKGAYTGPPPKNLSVKEAMELAKKGIRVPRDD